MAESVPKKLQSILTKGEKGENLVPDLTENELADIKSRVCDGYDMDLETMSDYLKRYEEIMELATMKAPSKDKTFPFTGASQVMMPYLSQAAIDFNSRTVPEVVNKRSIAKVATWGTPDYDEEMRADRVSSAINWWLKVGIEGWTKRMDFALLYAPTFGQYFKKKWWSDGEIKEAFITANNMIYDHDSTSFDDSPRKSHNFQLEYNDYHSKVVSGEYEEIEGLEDKNNGQPEERKPLEMVESHCTLDMDGDGYCEPYIVTWCKKYECIVRIEPRYTADDIVTIKGKVYKIYGEEFFTQTGFIPNLEKPAVYDGWGTLMYDLYESLNTFMRQLIDAGTLNNIAANSGFINSNVKMGGRAKKGKFNMIMGQLTPVDVGSGQNLNQSIWTPQFSGPQQGLHSLLTEIREEVRIYTTASQNVDVSAGEAASLYLARLQQALKVPNAVTSRVYAGLGEEFQRIYYLMGRYMDEDMYMEIIDWEPEIPPEVEQQYMEALAAAEATGNPPPASPVEIAYESFTMDMDFNNDLDIVPTADPNLGSDVERIARSEAVYMQSFQDPGINQYEARKHWLQSLNVPDIDEMAPPPNNEPSQQDIINAEYMKSEIEVNKTDSASKMAKAQVEMLKAQVELAKVEAEIDKLESETVKNYAEVDAKERMALIAFLKEERDSIRQQLGAEDANTIAVQSVAQGAGNQGSNPGT